MRLPPPAIFATRYSLIKDIVGRAVERRGESGKARIRRAQGHFVKPWLGKGRILSFLRLLYAILPYFKLNIYIPVMATTSFAKML